QTSYKLEPEENQEAGSRTNLSDLLENLTFDPPQQPNLELFPLSPLSLPAQPFTNTPMDTAGLLNTIAEMQKKMQSLRDQNKKLEESMSDVSMYTAPPSPRKPNIKIYTAISLMAPESIQALEQASNTSYGSMNTQYARNLWYYHKKSAEWMQKYGKQMPFKALTKILLTEYGLMNGDQTLLLLQVFCNNSCPELSPVFLSCVDTKSTGLLALLYKLRDDGRRYAARRLQNVQGQQRHQRQRSERHHRPQQAIPHLNLDAGGEGNAARGSLTCFVCGKEGHKMMHCPLAEKAKQLARGSAHVAAVTNECQGKSDDSEEGEVWMMLSPYVTYWNLHLDVLPITCAAIARYSLAYSQPVSASKLQMEQSFHLSNREAASITTFVDEKPKAILLTDAYVADGLSQNLISVKILDENGLYCLF
ncbi:hypothetical protein GN958_ATG00545, partial [Phytophthora infestans]